jgi:hypothetical protein
MPFGNQSGILEHRVFILPSCEKLNTKIHGILGSGKNDMCADLGVANRTKVKVSNLFFPDFSFLLSQYTRFSH